MRTRKPSYNQAPRLKAGPLIVLLLVLALGYQLIFGNQESLSNLVDQLPMALQTQPQSQLDQAIVTRVVDGDTIVVTIGGKEYRVRYIGVDTPESTTKQECYGREAARFNRSLVDGQTVRLERDVNETDRFGRLLRYVYLPSGEMVNEILVREGYALARSFPPDVKYQERLRAAEREARQAQRGLWAACPNPGS
jgi:micrococcal nuclease